MKRSFVLPVMLVACALMLRGQMQMTDLGRIDFPTSGAPQAQPHFLRGVLLLHNFEYRDARKSFGRRRGSSPVSPWPTGARP